MASSTPRNNPHTKFSPKLKLRNNDVAKQPYISFPLLKIAIIQVQKHQTQAFYTPIRPGQAKFKAQNQ